MKMRVQGRNGRCLEVRKLHCVKATRLDPSQQLFQHSLQIAASKCYLGFEFPESQSSFSRILIHSGNSDFRHSFDVFFFEDGHTQGQVYVRRVLQ